MIEVKQGPFAGEGDKTRFEGRLPEDLKYKCNSLTSSEIDAELYDGNPECFQKVP